MDRTFTPTRTYDIQLKIKNLDFTNDVISLSFTSSLATAYQVINISLLLNTDIISLEDLYSEKDLKLSIRLLGYLEQPLEDIKTDLIIVKLDHPVVEKVKLSTNETNAQIERVPVTITAVPKNPFKSLNTVVNRVYIGKNLRYIINDLSSLVGATTTYDNSGENTETIDQVCIPPTTFYNIIKEHQRKDPFIFNGFLDQRFGLFDGVPGVFCQYDNHVYIKNITKKIEKTPAFTVYHLSTEGDEQTSKIIDESGDGKTFYTYSKITTEFSINAKVANIATTLKNIVKPSDSLSQTITQNLSTLAAEKSLSFRNKRFNYDIGLNRTKYYNEDTGYEDSEVMFNSRYGRLLSDTATISLFLEKNMRLLNLINVGEAVDFKPKSIENSRLGGKYILWSSIITFRKRGDWGAVAQINLIRTNRII